MLPQSIGINLQYALNICHYVVKVKVSIYNMLLTKSRAKFHVNQPNTYLYVLRRWFTDIW